MVRNRGMTRANPLPDSLPDPAFTVEKAQGLGLRRSRLRALDLLAPSRSIRVRSGMEMTLAERCRPYLELLPGAFLSHGTAAQLHGFPLPSSIRWDPAIHLSRPRGMAAPRRRNVAGHRLVLNEAELTVIAGLPITTLARTLHDLSTCMELSDLVVAGDWMISEHRRNFGSSRSALLPLSELRSYVASKAGNAGLPKLRSAVDLMRVGVDSPPEDRKSVV